MMLATATGHALDRYSDFGNQMLALFIFIGLISAGEYDNGKCDQNSPNNHVTPSLHSLNAPFAGRVSCQFSLTFWSSIL
jgi:hypothetical protein